jgi:hypothetical protein
MSIFDSQKDEYQICIQLLLLLHSKWYVSNLDFQRDVFYVFNRLTREASFRFVDSIQIDTKHRAYDSFLE